MDTSEGQVILEPISRSFEKHRDRRKPDESEEVLSAGGTAIPPEGVSRVTHRRNADRVVDSNRPANIRLVVGPTSCDEVSVVSAKAKPFEEGMRPNP